MSLTERTVRSSLAGGVCARMDLANSPTDLPWNCWSMVQSQLSSPWFSVTPSLIKSRVSSGFRWNLIWSGRDFSPKSAPAGREEPMILLISLPRLK